MARGSAHRGLVAFELHEVGQNRLSPAIRASAVRPEDLRNRLISTYETTRALFYPPFRAKPRSGCQGGFGCPPATCGHFSAHRANHVEWLASRATKNEIDETSGARSGSARPRLPYSSGRGACRELQRDLRVLSIIGSPIGQAYAQA